jgi:integrase
MQTSDALAYYGQWRLGAGGYSVKTWEGELPTLRGFCSRMPLAIEDMNAAWVEQWWAETAGLAQDTRVTRLGQVRAFLRYCRERGWLTGDPTALINAKAAPVRERDRLDADELLALLELAKYPLHRAFLALAMNLGLRGSEVARLRISDVDLDGGTILVRIEKTNDEHRMPITLELHNELVRWLRHYQATCDLLTRDSLLVPSQHVSGNTITYRPDRKISEPYEIVKRYLAELGWDTVKQEGVHTIRRSVARLLFDSMSIAVDGTLLGKAAEDSALLATMTFLHHSRPETTLRYIGKNHLRDALDTRLRGKAFLSALGTTNVRRLDVTA